MRAMAPAALSGPGRQIIKIRRTLNGGAPDGLEPGELSVQMAPRTRLWVGVPNLVDVAERRLVNVGHVTIGTDRPLDPEIGDFWFDTNEDILRLWTGSTWIGAAAGASIFARVAEEFTPPEVGGTVEVLVDNAEWLEPGLILQIEGLTYVIQSINGLLVTLLRIEGTPSQLGPGVVDGSDVAVGEIGEYRQGAVLPANPIIFPQGSAIGTHVVVITLTISPGDWEIHGYMQGRMTSGGGGTFNVYLTDDLNMFDMFIRPSTLTFLSAPNVTNFTFPARRFNITQPLIIRAAISSVATLSHDLQLWGYMAARRVR